MALLESLAASYHDHDRILTRPLVHLGMVTEPSGHAYPLIYLTSAFLDTRPFIHGGSAVLRLMTVARHHPEGPDLDPPLMTEGDLWCVWLDGGHHMLSSPLRSHRYRCVNIYAGPCYHEMSVLD